MGAKYTIEERDGRKVRVYESGAVLDDSTGKIIKPPPHVIIDEESSIVLHRRKLEMKQEIARQAANQAVQDGRFVSAWGDMAFIGAIIDSAMIKATTPEDPKAIEAARFVLSQTGYDDSGSDPGFVSTKDLISFIVLYKYA